MRSSEISFRVKLDQDNIPEEITWRADEQQTEWTDTRAINIALWDHRQFNTPSINLWTKDMTVEEMKHFYIDCIGGLGQNLLTSTGDEQMSDEIRQLCDKLVKMVDENNKT